MSTAKLQRILRFRMGSHLLPIEQGRHLRLPRHTRVCRLCHTGALGDERHMLLECPALADLRDEFSPLIAECSGGMARLVWARNQPMVSKYIIACLDRMSCWLNGLVKFSLSLSHADDMHRRHSVHSA